MEKSLRILEVGTGVYSSPAPAYAGVENMVWFRADGLARRGHHVILAAPVGSKCPQDGELIETVKPTTHIDNQKLEAMAYEKYEHLLSDVDVIIDDSWCGNPYTPAIRKMRLKDEKGIWRNGKVGKVCDVPVMHVCHSELPFLVPPPVDKPSLIGLSNPHTFYLNFMWNKNVRTVHNCMDVDNWPLVEKKDDYLLYLSVFIHSKGSHMALNLASQLGKKIILAGETEYVDDPRYVEDIKAACDQYPDAEFKGRITNEEKKKLMGSAEAYLFPIDPKRLEPFGLTMLEAAACGTPTVATASGGPLDIIEHEKTGYLCYTYEQFISSIKKVRDIEAIDCRKRAEEFSVDNMAKIYEDVCKERIAGGW